MAGTTLGRLAGFALGLALAGPHLPPAFSDEASEHKKPNYVLSWGSNGSGPGEFYSPISIAITPQDEVFITDLNNSRVQQFTTDGQFVSEFPLPLDNPPRVSCIIGGLAIDPDGLLYLSFMVQHKIQVYTKTGELVRQWGNKGAGNGEFNQPGGIVIRSDGTLLVTDQGNHRIEEFTLDGKFLRTWGEYGDKPGQFGAPEPKGSRFAGPHFLTQDSRGNLYTTEGAAGRVQQFDAHGQPLLVWGSKTQEPGAFGEYQFGSLKNTFGPIGVFADSRDRIWVSSLNDRVQCFTSDGKFLFRLDGIAPGDTFTHPHGMAEDSHGYFYIADSGNQRICKFKLPEE